MTKDFDWIESQAQRNFDYHMESAGIIKAQANQAMTIVLAGLGGASGFLISLFREGCHTSLIAAAASFAAGMTLIAIVLTMRVIAISEYPTPTNAPREMLGYVGTQEEMRRVTLDNLGNAIDKVIETNYRAATWLSRMRLALILMPFVSAVIGLSAAWAVGHF